MFFKEWFKTKDMAKKESEEPHIPSPEEYQKQCDKVRKLQKDLIKLNEEIQEQIKVQRAMSNAISAR